MGDLGDAIIPDGILLELHSCGHPARPQSLDNFAVDLFARYRQLGGISDLDTAIHWSFVPSDTPILPACPATLQVQAVFTLGTIIWGR